MPEHCTVCSLTEGKKSIHKDHTLLQADFNTLAAQTGGENAGFCFSYDEPLSHLIYAGCDFILVPSMFEPCGLTQASCCCGFVMGPFLMGPKGDYELGWRLLRHHSDALRV